MIDRRRGRCDACRGTAVGRVARGVGSALVVLALAGSRVRRMVGGQRGEWQAVGRRIGVRFFASLPAGRQGSE